MSSRATPDSLMPTPTSRSFPYALRGVDMPVADLQRIPHGLARVIALDLPRSKAERGDRRPLYPDHLLQLVHKLSPTHPAGSYAPDFRCYAWPLPGD